MPLDFDPASTSPDNLSKILFINRAHTLTPNLFRYIIIYFNNKVKNNKKKGGKNLPPFNILI